ncbi:MAG: hypothetical protein H6Q82_113 [Deltaproteobacteria bacterium]|nr:hypothetical protein [Deltaproteobacteria bacterium]MBP2682122.1 hypothetical protein [Deltaproteobacteria bacterium]
MMRPNRTLGVGLAMMTLIAISLPAYAGEPAPADKWTFALRPYLWAPGISGTLKYDVPPSGGGGANVDISSYVLENLNMALMLNAEARKGDWSLLTDVVYLDVESDDSTVKSVSFTGPGGRIDVSAGADLGTKVKLTGVEWELAGAYTVARGRNSSLDVLAGFRYLGIEAKTDWKLSGTITDNVSGRTFASSGSTSDRVDLWDGIVGIRGTVGLGDSRWAIPYYLDLGAGSSAFTWQGMAGIEYRYSWGELQLLYRYLYYDLKGDKLLQNVSLNGPAIGVNFRF